MTHLHDKAWPKPLGEFTLDPQSVARVQAEHLAAADRPREGFDAHGMYVTGQRDDGAILVDQPPFKPGDWVRHKTEGVGHVFDVDRRTCFRDVPWIVTVEANDGSRREWYARDCRPFDDSAAMAEAVRESFEDCDQIERLREQVEQLSASELQARSEVTRLRTVDECLRVVYRQLLLSVGNNFWAHGEGTLGECMARGIRELVEKVALCRDKLRPPPQWYSVETWELRLHHDYGMPKGPAHRTAKIMAEHCQAAFERGMYLGLGHLDPLAAVEVGPGDRV